MVDPTGIACRKCGVVHPSSKLTGRPQGVLVGTPLNPSPAFRGRSGQNEVPRALWLSEANPGAQEGCAECSTADVPVVEPVLEAA